MVKVGDQVIIVDKYAPFHPKGFVEAIHVITKVEEEGNRYRKGTTWVEGDDRACTPGAWRLADGSW